MVIISAILIIGIISVFYKPTYAVTLNGEFIGYTNDKNELQKRINEQMKGIEQNGQIIVVKYLIRLDERHPYSYY